MDRDDLSIPTDLNEALDANAAVKAIFDRYPQSHRREYIRWVDEAKKPETRKRRIGKAIAAIGEK